MRCPTAGVGVLAALLLACAAARGSPAVPAELWAYVDGAGVAHFAARPVDARYRRLYGDGPATRRVDGKADAVDRLLLWLEFAPEVKALAPWLRDAARTHGVDAELLTAVIAVESAFDPRAVSPRGAIGLMQITTAAADGIAGAIERSRPAGERLLDARVNIDTGARLLAGLLRRFGRVDHALAAWNAGEGAVRRHGGVPPIDETRAHVHQVLELYWALLQRSLAARAQSLVLR